MMTRSRLRAAALTASLALSAGLAGAETLPISCVAAGGYASCSLAPGGCDESPTGAVPQDATRLLRFVQLSDVHIYDDDASAALTGSALEVPLEAAIQNNSAQRLQDEYTDELLNAMVSTINACHAVDPIELMIATGDNTDNMTLNEIRRYIDNLDGVAAGDTAFEAFCGYLTHDSNGDPKLGMPECSPELQALFALPTGKLVADAESNAPDPFGPAPNGPLDSFAVTRSPRQIADTAASSAVGLSYSIAPGLPRQLRCEAGGDCTNWRLAMPYYAVFGNHDGANRGTLTFQQAFQAGAVAHGRYFFESQREWINEFFATAPLPGPEGHGFENAGTRLDDADDRNDGYYTFAAGADVRLIVLNTLYDGVRSQLGPGGPVLDLHMNGATGTATGGHVRGNEATNPIGLETGVLPTEQYDWLAGELAAAAAAGEPVLVFSHHPDHSFSEHRLGFPADGGKTSAELDELLGRAMHGGSASTVVAWIAGHTHQNLIRACRPGACPIVEGGASPAIERAFWRIETSSLIDYPQEGRIVELYSLASGGHAIRLTMISPDPNDDTARVAHELSKAEASCNVSQMLAAGQAGLEGALALDFCHGEAALETGAGRPKGAVADRDVVLLP